MKVLIYSFQTAFKSLWLEKWINFLTVLSISIGLSILSAFIMITLNMDTVIQRWSKSFGIVVYLNEDVSDKAIDSLKKHFRRDPDILNVKFISKELALKDLRQTLGENTIIIEELKDNPLPSSFELTLKKELLEPTRVRQKSAKIEQMPGIEEVQYGEQWLSSLSTITRTMKIGVIFFGCAIFIAITFITYSTIKIFFYRRKEEIETLKLLGATRGFIRLPFLIEGLFIGILGGMISSLALFGAYSFTVLKFVEFLPSIGLIITTLPLQIYILVPVAGAVMSFTGSFIAVGKIRY